MPDREQVKKSFKLRFFPHGILLILILSVIFLSVMAFINPAAQDVTPTPSPFSTTSAADVQENATQSFEGAGTDEPVAPPSPEEVGSTDSIIIWSTVLILILIIGTLRETILHKDQ